MDSNVSIVGHQDINKRMAAYDSNAVIEEGQGPTVKTNAGKVITEEDAKKLPKENPWWD